MSLITLIYSVVILIIISFFDKEEVFFGLIFTTNQVHTNHTFLLFILLG